MVGNDIVDLNDPDADSTSYDGRFDARVFTRAERNAIARAGSPESTRWRLWAAKEASYKLARKCHEEAVFSPRAFVVHPDRDGDPDRVRVVHHETSYFVEFVRGAVESSESPQHVHAIAVRRLDDLASVFAGVKAIDPSSPASWESDAVRSFACDSISQRFRLQRDQLEIRKTSHRIPTLYHRDEILALSVSLSHHGAWLAFACCEGEEHRA